MLQRRQKWNNSRRNLAVADIVLIADETTPRSCWPLARVIEVMPGSDGFVRRVKVKTKTTVLERPVTKCVLLEATEENEHQEHLSKTLKFHFNILYLNCA